MYARRVTLHNYGPIERLDIELPFSGDLPKPVVLVGENGSGKTILLSHIVNGLMMAKSAAYPETPEIDRDKVYKLRSADYIKAGAEYYFSQVDFDNDLFAAEIRSRRAKNQYDKLPPGIQGSSAEALWNAMLVDQGDHLGGNISSRAESVAKARNLFSANCILYFPSDRSEDPAWLTRSVLDGTAEYTNKERFVGYTERHVIASSPLRDNRNWLFDVVYDRASFELQTINMNLPLEGSDATIPLPIFTGYSGDATQMYEAATQVVRTVIEAPEVRFGVAKRSRRAISLESAIGTVVPNVFQLSSGEVALLNLFLSVLRDFDMCDVQVASTSDIRGIVVVDEVDLHLHVSHQYEVLPRLIQMFPKVQFIITTHSPLFVLGMEAVFGKEGFELYRLPRGEEIDPEEFSEFSHAYQSFSETRRFSDDMRTVVENAQKPVVFLEGTTDQAYLKRAAQFFEKGELLDGIELRDGEGKGNLDNVWRNLKPPLTDILNQKVMLLYDADASKLPENRGRLLRRTVPAHPDNPIEKGIENLLSKETLERALEYRVDFIDIEGARTDRIKGTTESVPETWSVNDDQKTNLCNWLCENGTAEDFQNFLGVFELLEDLLDGEGE